MFFIVLVGIAVLAHGGKKGKGREGKKKRASLCQRDERQKRNINIGLLADFNHLLDDSDDVYKALVSLPNEIHSLLETSLGVEQVQTC